LSTTYIDLPVYGADKTGTFVAMKDNSNTVPIFKRSETGKLSTFLIFSGSAEITESSD